MYKDEANYTDAALAAALVNPAGTAVIRHEVRLIIAAHRQYAELTKTRAHLFDDGRIYLLDLTNGAEVYPEA